MFEARSTVVELVSEAQIGGPQDNFNSINATINHAGDVIAFEDGQGNALSPIRALSPGINGSQNWIYELHPVFTWQF